MQVKYGILHRKIGRTHYKEICVLNIACKFQGSIMRFIIIAATIKREIMVQNITTKTYSDF